MMEKYLVGLYNDEEILLKAVRDIKSKGYSIDNVYTPFPVHGLDEELGLKETQLHSVGFIAGATGCILALVFMSWANGFNYPLNIGGKPFIAIPAYIPITFELTVLFASIAMVLAYMIRNGIYPGNQPKVFDRRTTDDLFAVTFNLTDNEVSSKYDDIKNALTGTGAVEVKEKDFSEEDED